MMSSFDNGWIYYGGWGGGGGGGVGGLRTPLVLAKGVYEGCKFPYQFKIMNLAEHFSDKNTVLSHWESIWLSRQFYFSKIFGYSPYWGSPVMMRSRSINNYIFFYDRPPFSTSPCQVSLDHSLVSTHTISCKVNCITRQTKHWSVLENTLRQRTGVT